MLVVMVMEARYPFGKDWAEAARLGGAQVVEVEVVPHAEGPHIARGVAGSGDHFQIERVPLRPDRFLRPLSVYILGRRISRVIAQVERERRVDIIHTHFYREMGPVLHMRRRPAHVHTEHSAAFSALDLGPAAHYRPTKSGLRVAIAGSTRAAAVIAVCRYLADQMVRYGIPEPIHVIPCPIDPSMTNHEIFEPPLTPRLVTVGRLSPEKRVDLLLDAMVLARIQEPRLTLDVIGGGALEAKLREHAVNVGVDDCVTFHGALPRDRVAELCASSSAFVTGTLSEMFGTACAEALCLGLPVVAPDVGGLPELVTDNNGRLVADADPQQMADAILQVLNIEYDRPAIAAAARSRMSQARVGEQLADLYNDAATAHARR